MDMANQYNGMVIGTGDMSELALGWATYNGDHMSMYGVNASVPKTLVRHLVHYYADSCEDAELKAVLYDVLDSSRLFRCHAQPGSRSGMNVTFRTGDAELDAAFVAGAAGHQIQNVKGHRLVGGMRASVYNAVTMEDVQALASYMKDFEAQHSLSPRSN